MERNILDFIGRRREPNKELEFLEKNIIIISQVNELKNYSNKYLLDKPILPGQKNLLFLANKKLKNVLSLNRVKAARDTLKIEEYYRE